MTSVSNPNTSGQVDSSKLLSASLLSIVGAAVANLVLYFAVNAFYDAPEGFLPLTPGPILFFTVLGTSLGALVFWFLTRRSDTPIRAYRVVATVAAIVSIIPNVLGAISPTTMPFPFPADSTAFLLLILFHVVAAVVSVWILTTRSAR